MGNDHDYELADSLGVGSYGDCYVGYCRNAGHDNCGDVAVKLCTSSRNEDVARFRNEVAMMKRLDDSQHVIDVITDVYTGNSGDLQYAMELGLGDLDNYLTSTPNISFEDKVRLAIEICQGIADAHANDIVHRDLHFKNVIIVQGEQTTTAKINDFGKGKDYTELDILSSGLNLGAPMVWSPESLFNTSVLQEKDKYMKVDIYSAGLVMNYLFSGLYPSQYITELVASLERYFRLNNISALPLLPPRVNPSYNDDERKGMYEGWLNENGVPVEALLRVDLPSQDQDTEERINLILVKATSWDYNERYDSMNDLIEELKQCLPQ